MYRTLTLAIAALGNIIHYAYNVAYAASELEDRVTVKAVNIRRNAAISKLRSATAAAEHACIAVKNASAFVESERQAIANEFPGY